MDVRRVGSVFLAGLTVFFSEARVAQGAPGSFGFPVSGDSACALSPQAAAGPGFALALPGAGPDVVRDRWQVEATTVQEVVAADPVT